MRRFGLCVFLSLFLSACGSSGAMDAGDAGAGGASDADGASVGGAPTCAAYCDAIQAACTASNQQYGDVVTCETSCAAFPVGAGADTSGDTLGCRIHYTAMASEGVSAAAMYCLKAGPGGDGTCGTNCEGFCDLVLTYCTAANSSMIYPDRMTCMADCATHGTDARFTTGDPGRTDMGNEVACQLYHAVMGSQAPEEHCLGDLATTALTCRE